MPTNKKPIPKIQKVQSTVAKKDSKFASVGRYTIQSEDGSLVDDAMYRSRIAGLKGSKTAGIIEGGDIGMANITDSGNMGFYNFEFPVDSLELPQSRAEELRFYKIAYDRDPIVARGIDLHTEIPMSKINLEKPKCSSQEFADYVFDFFQGFVNRTRLFEMFLHGTREYWATGEAFFYVEQDSDVKPCERAQKEIAKNKPTDKNPDNGQGGMGETDFNSPINGDELGLIRPSRLSKLAKILKIPAQQVMANLDKFYYETQLSILDTQDKIKQARTVVRQNTTKTAEPPSGDAGEAGAPDIKPNPKGGESGGDGGDVDSLEMSDDLGGGMPYGSGGGHPSNPLAGTPLGDRIDEALDAKDQDPMDATSDPEKFRLKKYLKLLEKQKELLEELKTLRDNKAKDREIFSHITNKEYYGPDRIQLLPPETIEINVDPLAGPQIMFKPSERQKQVYLESPDVDPEIKESLEQNGTIPLNTDPMNGSYVIHFARKKAPFEPHGRSILQRCLRTILYRDKLRQVQTTLASRNMTPKTLISAPNVPQTELLQLRAHVDEAKADPDYTVIVNYECTWNEIGSEGRLLALDSEWAHTNQDLAAGLGFTPEILTGEGMYSNSRIQLEILNTTYLQFRDIISDIIENLIFRPIAMKKGFFEIDKYNRPRWIYPKVSFARMALRDSGDLYEMLYNLYVKGSIPIEIILEFLSIDPEACKTKLEEDLFTVNDSKFNEFIVSFYNTLANDERLIQKTDVVDKLMKSLGLKAKDSEDEEGLEGTGEGVQ